MAKATIISVPLRKGGSGKTTTSTNVATGLMRRGRRVLLVDLDDQANATMCVGLNPFALEASINTLLTDIAVEPRDVVVTTGFGLDVLPATQELEDTAAGMTATSVHALGPIFEALANDYDYIIIDTQPGHSYLSLSALVASDYAIIPLQAHYLAMEGLARIVGDIERVQHGDVVGSWRGPNPKLRILGIVPVMVQSTNVSQIVIDKVRSDYPDLVLPVEVRLSVNFVNSSLEGVPLVVSDPKHAGSQAYMALVDAIIQKLEG
jgi:chromosome partitioning protein